MCTAKHVWLDVSCIQCGQDFSAGNSAASSIGISDNNPKSPLTQTRYDKGVFAVSILFLGKAVEAQLFPGLRLHARINQFFPQTQSFMIICLISLADDN